MNGETRAALGILTVGALAAVVGFAAGMFAGWLWKAATLDAALTTPAGSLHDARGR